MFAHDQVIGVGERQTEALREFAANGGFADAHWAD
jgi:hypothetical protein